MTPEREEFEKWFAGADGGRRALGRDPDGDVYNFVRTEWAWQGYKAAGTLTPLAAARTSCPFCAADWPVEYSHGECPVIHVRPASLWRNPSADHVQCQAARLRAMAENWPFNPVIAAERG